MCIRDSAISECFQNSSCLYLADTGDNRERRRAGSISIRRLEAPDLLNTSAQSLTELSTDVFPLRLPNGPRDIETLFVLSEAEIYLATKGRNDPVSVYRYPPPLRPDTVTLELVQELSPGARVIPRQLTGGSVSPEGDLIALRTLSLIHISEPTRPY